MTPVFNLLDEPWIPVRDAAGEVHDVNLADALLHAAEFAGLAETSPPNLIALYRVLLAIVHRALATRQGQWRDTDRAGWFQEGLPSRALKEYLEIYRNRFWLFHPDEPFMQVPALATAPETKDKRKPWTQISLEGASGSTPVVFDHSLDDAPQPISYAQACRNLLGYLQFTPGGLVKTFRVADKAGALADSAAILPIGATLEKTLILALHPWVAFTDADLPAWELPAPTIADLCAAARLQTGVNDRYSRLTRAVLLESDDTASTVRYLRFGEGLAQGDDDNLRDPMACYRFNKDGKALRVSFQEGRAVWRDLPSLVPDTSGRFDLPPAVLGWAINLYDALGLWEAPVPVMSAGLASDQAKLLRWRAERIELPRALLADPQAAMSLREEVRRAEGVHFRVSGICADMIAAAMPDSGHKDTRARARAIQENGASAAAYFSAAERGLPALMQGIVAGDLEKAHDDWSRVLALAAERAWEAAQRSLGNSPAVLRAVARTDWKLRHLLRTLRPEAAPIVEETT